MPADLAVHAWPSAIAEGCRVRLVNGANTHAHIGRLEVWHNKAWHSLCSFGNGPIRAQEALVICKQLGWGRDGTVISLAPFGPGMRVLQPYGYGCSGVEPTFEECDWQYIGRNNTCLDGSQPAAIECRSVSPVGKCRQQLLEDECFYAACPINFPCSSHGNSCRDVYIKADSAMSWPACSEHRAPSGRGFVRWTGGN